MYEDLFLKIFFVCWYSSPCLSSVVLLVCCSFCTLGGFLCVDAFALAEQGGSIALLVCAVEGTIYHSQDMDVCHFIIANQCPLPELLTKIPLESLHRGT